MGESKGRGSTLSRGSAAVLGALAALVSAFSCEDKTSQAKADLTPEAVARFVAAAPPCGLDADLGRWFYNPPQERLTQGNLSLFAKAACFAEPRPGCESAEACLGITLAVLPGDCDGRRSACEGDLALQGCAPSGEGFVSLRRLDCAAYGQTCVLGSCRPSGGTKCSESSYQDTRCESGTPYYCDAGAEATALPCVALGRACIVTFGEDVAGALCGGAGPVCDRAAAGRAHALGCDGPNLRECAAGGREATVDCSRWVKGASCQQVYNEAAGVTDVFCGIASECSPFLFRTHCEGDSLVFCNGGRVERPDCKALGFAACEDRGAGARCALAPGAAAPP